MIFSRLPPKFPLLPMEILGKTKLYFRKFCKNVLHPLITPENFTSFSVNPQSFNMIFLQYPRNSTSSTHPLSFSRDVNFEGRPNHPRMKLWFRGEEVLLKKCFILHIKKILRKPRKYQENQGSCDFQFKYCETVCVKILH